MLLFQHLYYLFYLPKLRDRVTQSSISENSRVCAVHSYLYSKALGLGSSPNIADIASLHCGLYL